MNYQYIVAPTFTSSFLGETTLERSITTTHLSKFFRGRCLQHTRLQVSTATASSHATSTHAPQAGANPV